MPETATAVAERLRASVAGAADANDANRALTDALVRQLKAAGAFRLLIPGRYGGLEAPFPDFLKALQVYAEADASTAWCISQGAVIGTTSVWLAEAQIRAIWSDPDACIANGPPGPCEAERRGDSWILNGRWGFSSGCRHATWMTGALKVRGSNRWVCAFVPKRRFASTTLGMCKGCAAPAAWSFPSKTSKWRMPGWPTWATGPTTTASSIGCPPAWRLPPAFAAVALGVARAALDAVFDLASEKVQKMGAGLVKDDPDAQKMLGEAEIRWRAGRAFLHDTVSGVLAELKHQESITDDQRIALRMAGTHVIREAAAALNLAYTAAGSTGIYRHHPLHRRFQDMNVITQHIQARMSYYGFVGRHLLGHPFVPGPMN
ncbi:MAG: acyl-CoA dehydrogenase family protein [Gammaproteobacteria bacterium]|nr:acyl-CoA dehydrogenase family protein [Gammaproteobacteria bacterium]MDE0272884.1 acyl-CoA dehydrogenase family protein [Gammaproteobacteria bacterium]